MRSAHISRRQAEASFDGMDADLDDVFAVQADVARLADADELADAYELLDRLDRELAAASHAALVRAPRFTDPRRAGRSRRRANRVVLRSLPTRLDIAELSDVEGEAA
ncbi:hypothetical protein [Prauserella endophytica]|uniref:Uncharacterized protein n=1 Tax=Prauserella endophytica TaxID=1592324 RepID=A0ABY2S0I8_9PSEU|nr:hypothetical protein [Prauserella endophytica]TKG67529.1 hypothetical protein FCN18_22470 [Prauserella endophytica]